MKGKLFLFLGARKNGEIDFDGNKMHNRKRFVYLSFVMEVFMC